MQYFFHRLIAHSIVILFGAVAKAIATGSWSVANANGFADSARIPLALAIDNLRRIVGATGTGLAAACIPDVEEDERLSWNMQRPELLGLARLIGRSLLRIN